MNSGACIAIVNGISTHLSATWQKASVGMWMVTVAATCLVAHVEFVFCYLRVVHNYTMTYKWLVVLVAIITLCSVTDGVLLFLALDSVTDHNAQFGHLMSDPMWLEGRRTVAFHAADTV